LASKWGAFSRLYTAGIPKTNSCLGSGIQLWHFKGDEKYAIL
jgi:hypothetical protein